MKLFRVRRVTSLGLLGAGFLLGSRAGEGPWNKARAGWKRFQEKAGPQLPAGVGRTAFVNSDPDGLHTPVLTEF